MNRLDFYIYQLMVAFSHLPKTYKVDSGPGHCRINMCIYNPAFGTISLLILYPQTVTHIFTDPLDAAMLGKTDPLHRLHGPIWGVCLKTFTSTLSSCHKDPVPGHCDP